MLGGGRKWQRRRRIPGGAEARGARACSDGLVLFLECACSKLARWIALRVLLVPVLVFVMSFIVRRVPVLDVLLVDLGSSLDGRCVWIFVFIRVIPAFLLLVRVFRSSGRVCRVVFAVPVMISWARVKLKVVVPVFGRGCYLRNVLGRFHANKCGAHMYCLTNVLFEGRRLRRLLRWSSWFVFKQ